MSRTLRKCLKMVKSNKRGKLNKARAILGIIKYLEDYVYSSNQPDINVYLIQLTDDLKRKRISKVTKKSIRYHAFFDYIVT